MLLSEPGPPPNHRRLRATHPLGDLHPRQASAAKARSGPTQPAAPAALRPHSTPQLRHCRSNRPNRRTRSGIHQRRVSMIGAATQRRAWRLGGRRPGHPRHRTVRHHCRPAEPGTQLARGGHGWGYHKLTDAELVTLAVTQACWTSPQRPDGCAMPASTLRYLFPTCPASPATTSGCAAPASCCAPRSGDRLRHHAVERRCVRGGLHPRGVRLLTPERQAVRLAGWAQYGYCANHSRWF
jgi:hypothetical protein